MNTFESTDKNNKNYNSEMEWWRNVYEITGDIVIDKFMDALLNYWPEKSRRKSLKYRLEDIMLKEIAEKLIEKKSNVKLDEESEVISKSILNEEIYKYIIEKLKKEAKKIYISLYNSRKEKNIGTTSIALRAAACLLLVINKYINKHLSDKNNKERRQYLINISDQKTLEKIVESISNISKEIKEQIDKANKGGKGIIEKGSGEIKGEGSEKIKGIERAFREHPDTIIRILNRIEAKKQNEQEV